MDNDDPLVRILFFFLAAIIATITSVQLQIIKALKNQRIEVGVQDSFHHKAIESLFKRYRILRNAVFILFSASTIWAFFSLQSLIPENNLLQLAVSIVSALFLYLLIENLGDLLFRTYTAKPQIWTISLWVSYVVAYFPARFLEILEKTFGRIIGSKQTEKKENIAVREKDHEITIFQNALDFSKVRVRDCAVPRTEIVSIDVNSSIAELTNVFTKTHFSKILVYKDQRDNLIGYVHSHDLFKKPENISNVLLPVFNVPDTLEAQKAFELFVKNKCSVAIVSDEFGGTSGILTVEDIIEEIFGEIDDEHDTFQWQEERVASGNYIFSGRLEISYLNEKYNLGLEESDEYDTLAGLILSHFEGFPEKGSEIAVQNILFTVEKVIEARIDSIRLKLLDSDPNHLV